MKTVLSAIGEDGSGGDAFADHLVGEDDGMLGGQFELAAACIAVHALVAVVLRLKVHDSGAVRVFAFVLAAIVPFVVVALGDLCQRLGFGLRIFCVLAGLAGKAVRVTPWHFRQFSTVSAAQATNVVFIANRVAVFLTAFVALCAP